MYYYVYLISFSTGHWYIGKRSSKKEPELDVKYTGSGKLLAQFKKNHKDFTKNIIATYQTEKEALDAEKYILGDSWKTDSFPKGKGLCLNLVEGGGSVGSGEDCINFGRKHSEESRLKMSQSHSGENNYWYGNGHLMTGEKNPFYGRTHTDEAKAKVSKANKGRLSGDKNPRFGVPSAHKGKFGSDHPMSKMTGDKNANYGKKQFCNLLGDIIMATPGQEPEGYHLWTRWGFTDKSLRSIYPRELRGNWI